MKLQRYKVMVPGLDVDLTTKHVLQDVVKADEAEVLFENREWAIRELSAKIKELEEQVKYLEENHKEDNQDCIDLENQLAKAEERALKLNIALDVMTDFPIYPQAFRGKWEKRTEHMEGWNACAKHMMEELQKVCGLEKDVWQEVPEETAQKYFKDKDTGDNFTKQEIMELL